MTPRHTGIVSLVILSIMAVSFALACVTSPRCASYFGLEKWNLPRLREWMKESDTKAGILQEKHEQLQHEIEFANSLAARLIDGTMTLAQATDEWVPVLRNRPGFADVCKLSSGVETERRYVARSLISRVEMMLDTDSRWPGISTRLEAEYALLQ
jgi:hypothetical protein